MAEQDKTDERLQSLQDLRGAALVSALVQELGALHRRVGHLQTEMTAFREYLAARDRWLETDTGHKARIQLPRTVAIDASQSLYPRQGFYNLEVTDKGVPFSWTGPSPNFSFDVFVDRSGGAELELRAHSCLDFERQKNVRLLVNGEPVATTVAQHGRGLILKAVLPASDDDHSTNLIFSVPEMLRASADSPDKRTLGIAFTALTITALADRRVERDETVISLARPLPKRAPDESDDSVAIVAADKAAS